jgi:hypothetical protein
LGCSVGSCCKFLDRLPASPYSAQHPRSFSLTIFAIEGKT